jgi:hypothetical protein
MAARLTLIALVSFLTLSAFRCATEPPEPDTTTAPADYPDIPPPGHP